VSKETESASVAPEGARRASGGAPEERRDGRGRWSAKRKFGAVSPSLTGMWAGVVAGLGGAGHLAESLAGISERVERTPAVEVGRVVRGRH